MTSRQIHDRDTYTLTAAAEQAGLSPHQVRIYLDMGLLRPCGTTSGGFRLFDADCIRRLKLIKAYRDAELNLPEVADFLCSLDADDAARCHEAEQVLKARLRDKGLALERCARVIAIAALEP